MDGYADVKSLPLSTLPLSTRRLLSCLMDTPKIIPTDGPDRLPRDWRGLAYRVNVSAELAANIQQFEDKTGRVLDIWLRDPFMTIGHLIEQLAVLDRYDVIDDICYDLREVISQSESALNYHNQLYLNDNASPADADSTDEETRIITYDDRPGYEHQYDAFVLHAKEDQEFVEELVTKLEYDGFQICTVDKLHAGHITQYKPVAKLISERCKRIILVYSPDFLISPSNKFYSTYAQAVSIETKLKIIPIMYRDCQLPLHLTYYHRLYYNNTESRAMYDFWPKLKQTLCHTRPQPRLNGVPINIPRININMPLMSTVPTTNSPLKITEVSTNAEVAHYMNQKLFLEENAQHRSMNDLDSLGKSLSAEDSKSLGNLSQTSDVSEGGKKKKSTISRIFHTFKGRKNKKAMLVAADS